MNFCGFSKHIELKLSLKSVTTLMNDSYPPPQQAKQQKAAFCPFQFMLHMNPPLLEYVEADCPIQLQKNSK